MVLAAYTIQKFCCAYSATTIRDIIQCFNIRICICWYKIINNNNARYVHKNNSSLCCEITLSPQSIPYIGLTSLSANEILSTEMPWYTAFQCTTTLEIPPQTVVKKQCWIIWVCLELQTEPKGINNKSLWKGQYCILSSSCNIVVYSIILSFQSFPNYSSFSEFTISKCP
jgi:hypothetical protein